jgi:pilus assembly protein FimV
VAGILTEPEKAKPGTIAAEPLALEMPSLDFTASTAPADPAAKLADTLLSQPAAKPAAKGSDGVGTRLDLAKAYLEIGDKEGARDLQKEVARSGSEAQRAEAEKLLGSL